MLTTVEEVVVSFAVIVMVVSIVSNVIERRLKSTATPACQNDKKAGDRSPALIPPDTISPY